MGHLTMPKSEAQMSVRVIDRVVLAGEAGSIMLYDWTAAT